MTSLIDDLIAKNKELYRDNTALAQKIIKLQKQLIQALKVIDNLAVILHGEPNDDEIN